MSDKEEVEALRKRLAAIVEDATANCDEEAERRTASWMVGFNWRLNEFSMELNKPEMVEAYESPSDWLFAREQFMKFFKDCLNLQRKKYRWCVPEVPAAKRRELIKKFRSLLPK